MAAAQSTADGATAGLVEGEPVEREQRVLPLELFFDLVFVFAITQVTGYLAADPTFEQLARGVLVLGALWWAWVGYAWLTNRSASDEGLARVFLLVAMAAMLVVALAVPAAFNEEALVFGIAYLVVRLLQLAGLWLLGDRTPEVRAAVRTLAVGATIGPALILLAAAFDGVAQGALWAVALLVDFGGAKLSTRGRGQWQVHAGHFAERHGLIVIVALGESIVALGVGAQALDLDARVIVGAVLGIALVGGLWWAYFDVVAIVAERRLAQASGAERGEIARDSYSYLHFLMVAGIILLALGVKKTLGDPSDPLKAMPAVCLFGGTALYFLGHVLFRLRNVRTLSRTRTIAIVALGVLLAAAGTRVDALVALGLATAVVVATIAYEVMAYAEARDRIRHAVES
jgi:low temperature requirement protein LtrA